MWFIVTNWTGSGEGTASFLFSFSQNRNIKTISLKIIDSVSPFTFEVETLLDKRYLTPWNTYSRISKVDDGYKVPYLSGSVFNSLS